MPNRQKAFSAAPELQQEEEEGRAEGIINAALKPKRSLWRKMVTAGLALFGVSVVAQGVQWVHTAWVQQDWIAMGGGVAGGLIVFAGVGSVVTEWRRLYRLRQRAEERDVARELLHSHGLGRGREFCEKLARQAGLDQGIRRCSAGRRRCMKRKTIVKWWSCTPNWCSRCSITRRGAKSAAPPPSRR